MNRGWPSVLVALALALALAPTGCGDDDSTDTARRDGGRDDGGENGDGGEVARDLGPDGGETSDGGPPCESSLVHGEGEPLAGLDECGRLSYGLYANQGESEVVQRLPDFSFAGYRGGGVALPTVVETKRVAPGDGDDRARIQAAIDEVQARSPDGSGFRGAVVLDAGTYQVGDTLRITERGVVLRGQGQGADGTILVATRAEQHDLIVVEGSGGLRADGAAERIVTSHVPVGATSFVVASAEPFAVGDRIGVRRTPNQDWIDDLDMARWGWTPSSYEIAFERAIVAIEGDELTIDVPIVDAMRAAHGGGEVFVADTSRRITAVGVEGLRLVSEFDGAEDEDHGWKAVRLRDVANGWVRDVTAVHFGYSAVSVEGDSRFVTVQDSAMLEPVSVVTGGRRYAFNVSGATGVLFQRCYSELARHDFVSGARVPGPNVWLDCYSRASSNDDGPHHRWATGLLFDNVRSHELHVENRQDSGSGHGWSGAQTLFWNSMAEGLRSFAPLGAMNWVVGSHGEQQPGQWTTEEPLGWYESHDAPVEPRSLYLTQLRDRLGMAAVEAVTIPAQREGRIWDLLAGWAGEGALVAADPASGDASCGGGISSGLACCAASCGSCGGTGCGGRPGGAAACCSSGVLHSSRSCADHDAPCVLDPAFAPLE